MVLPHYDSSSFQAVPITFLSHLTEALAQVGTINGHEIVLHFCHEVQR